MSDGFDNLKSHEQQHALGIMIHRERKTCEARQQTSTLEPWTVTARKKRNNFNIDQGGEK
jgi:hypothetical protein